MRTRRLAHRQQPRRTAEHAARQAATCAAQAATCHGAQQKLAGSLNVSPRTLRHWKTGQRSGEFEARPRGRRPGICDVATRNDVIRFLHRVTGPSVGLAALRALFPHVSRAILAELLARYRRIWRRRYHRSGYELTWHHAGAVWAMDFSQARYPVDGIYPYLFAVRDLASHRQPAWQPVASEKADEVLRVLADLMREHGAPLVLKSDNGSAFVAELTKAMLDEAAVWQLFSPAGHPQFNGALERSNSTLKTYTHQQAVAEGHPFRWTSDDLDRARTLANTISRPWGHRGLSPDQTWQSRAAITDQQRAQFQQALGEQRSIAAQDLGLDVSADLSHVDRSRLDRLAIARTLELLDYLTKKRVTRAANKPKRPSRKKLARDHSELAPASASSTPCAEKKKSRGLARSRAGATMQASSARREQVPPGNLSSPLRVSAQRERANSPWWRKPFTLLLSVVKAAKIKR